MHYSYTTPYNSPDHCRQIYWSDTVQWSHLMFGIETSTKYCIWAETTKNNQLTTCLISRRSGQHGRLTHPLHKGSAHFLHPQETLRKLQRSACAGLSPFCAVPMKDTHTYFCSCQGQDWHKQYITLLTKFTFSVLSSSLLPDHCVQATSKSMQKCSQAALFHSNWTSTLQQSCRFHPPCPEVFVTLKYVVGIMYFPLLKGLQVDMSTAYARSRKGSRLLISENYLPSG